MNPGSITINSIYERGVNVRKKEIEPLLLKISTVAKKLDMSRTSVYALIDAGHLQKVKTTYGARVPRESVEKYVRSLIAQSDK